MTEEELAGVMRNALNAIVSYAEISESGPEILARAILSSGFVREIEAKAGAQARLAAYAECAPTVKAEIYRMAAMIANVREVPGYMAMSGDEILAADKMRADIVSALEREADAAIRAAANQEKQG